MATKIIDALLITLGLDDRDYRRGSERTRRELRDTRREIGQASDEMGKAVARAARQFAVAFLGFSTASGLVRMLAQLNEGARQIGLLGLNTANAARELKKYANAAAAAGGSSDDLLSSVRKIQQEQTNFRLRGESAWLPYMRSLQMGVDWATKGELDLLMDFAEVFERITNTPGQGRPLANSIGLEMGIGQDTMNFLLKGPAAIKEFVSKQEALTRGYDKTAAAAEKLRERWVYLKQQAESLALTLLMQLQGPLTKLADWLSKISAEGINSGDWSQGIVAGVQKVTDAVRILWDLLQGIVGFFDRIGDIGNRINSALDHPFIVWMKKQNADYEKEATKTPKQHINDLMTKLGVRTPEQQIAQFAPALTAAEQRYRLPRGVLDQVVRTVGSGYNPTAMAGQGRKPGAGLFQLPASRGPEEDSNAVARMLKDFFESAATAVGLGQGTGVYSAGFQDIGLATLQGRNPLQAAVTPDQVGYGVLAPGARGAPENNYQFGNIAIYTQATDANGMAQAAQEAIRRRLDLSQADYGMR